MIGYWKFLGGWWSDDTTEAAYPASPGGQVPTLQTDGTVRWSAGAAAGGEILIDDASGEFLFDDASGDVLYDG